MKRREFLVTAAALAGSPVTSLTADAQSPANKIRSIQRLFVSEGEDKPWFYDRSMWPAYFAMLAGNQFSRFQLSFGIGYDFLREVTDAYFLFAYPFFLSVPGFAVRVPNLPDEERERNLQTLRFISDEAQRHGLEFQLGIWTHGYVWERSPNPNYVIEGLNAANHQAYCQAAMTMLLKACPAISGVTLRVHGESGVPEGNYDFWGAIFDGVKQCGRKMNLDLHAKGIDDRMIDRALQTGLPVSVSPKFWAEHMGMPYHQADIRNEEVPKADHKDSGLMALSAGSRSFTRYGYADLLREDRRYQILWRIWPGTQRLLLWADPVFAAGYARAFQFCGSSGVEIMEPLSFKGRRGSGQDRSIAALGRCAYADPSFKPRWDWQKYLATYQVWGRKLHNPDAEVVSDPSLAAASRILPIITTTHLPSAANNNYWPELYTNESLCQPVQTEYTDTPKPRVFGNTSPLDPQLFSRINDFADSLLQEERSAKYSPVEVAQWLEELASQVKPNQHRSIAIDCAMQAGIGRFFAAKFRAAALYRIYEKTSSREALEQAVRCYRQARTAWAAVAKEADGVYAADITFGELPWLRGHWSGQLAAIDADIAAIEKQSATGKPSDDPRVQAAIQACLSNTKRKQPTIFHQPTRQFVRSRAIVLSLSGPQVASVTLCYRHVNQSERWQSMSMASQGSQFTAAIPAQYTDSPYPLQYYFEGQSRSREAFLYPGFPPNLAGQPYYVVRASEATRSL